MVGNSAPKASDSDADLRARLDRAEKSLREEGHQPLASELTLGLLHKLGNLMTGVYFNLEAAEEALAPQHPASEALRAVAETIQQAQALLRRAADLNLPPGHECSYFEIGPLIREHWDLMKIVLPKSTTCEFTSAAQPLYVQASSEEFCEALLQLALATRAASPEGRTHVSVHAAPAGELDLSGFEPTPPLIPDGVAVLYRDNAGTPPAPCDEFRFQAFQPERGGKMNRLYRTQELMQRQNGALAARPTADGVEFLLLLPGVT